MSEAETTDNTEAPFFAGVVHGLRAWNVSGGQLHAPYRRTPWRRGGLPTAARCGSHSADEAPARECSCGLYALHPHSGIDIADDEVAGVVEAWGRVQVYEEGFRAQYARPVALFVRHRSGQHRHVRRLAATHCCELIELAPGQTPESVCQERGWGLGPETVAELLPDTPYGPIPYTSPAPPPPLPGGWGARRGWLGRAIAAVGSVLELAVIGVITIVMGLCMLAMWVAMALVGVSYVLSLFGIEIWDLDTAKGPPPLERRSDVKVTGAWTVRFNDEVRVHVVELTNRGEHAALAARAELEELTEGEGQPIGEHAIDVPVNLAPGERGLALHRASGPQATAEAGPVWAREGPADARAPARVRIRLERRGQGCIVLAHISADRPLRRIHFWALGLVDGEPELLVRDVVRNVKAGRSRQVLGRERSCEDPLPRFRVYPAFRQSQLTAKHGAAGRTATRPTEASSETSDAR